MLDPGLPPLHLLPRHPTLLDQILNLAKNIIVRVLAFCHGITGAANSFAYAQMNNRSEAMSIDPHELKDNWIV
jgi:hypothetical protein